MLNQVQSYIESQKLFTPSQRILIGISGGRDSVCLALILKQLGYSIALAHCNFKLRAEEANQDEAFVKEFAKNQALELFNIRFDTKTYADLHKISIQMAARDLRYNWFEKIRKEENFDYIGIAHNRDDVVETFFINLLRGTGVEGLTGIKAKKDNIVRPLLNISRDEINQFIEQENIIFRDDSTNASTKYIRNHLRHKVIPELRSISDQFDKTMVENISRFQQTQHVYQNEIAFKKSKLFAHLSDRILINIERLKHLNPLSTYLYEFLKPYGFSTGTISDLEEALDGPSGKQFFSKTHQIVKDRNELILTELKKDELEEIFFNKTTKSIDKPINLTFEIIKNEDYIIPKQSNIAVLDLDKLAYPLLLRPWKHGDFFMPLGMNRIKKLSNFFIDSKVSVVDKSKTFVVQSKNDIIWVVGQRIDDRYKVTETSKSILQITLTE